MNVLVKEGILGAILLIMGVFDRLYIDWHWVGCTKAWIIPDIENLMPCIPAKVHLLKWVYTPVRWSAGSSTCFCDFAGCCYEVSNRRRGPTRKRVAWRNRAGGIADLRCRPIYNTDGTIPQPASLTVLLQREPFARHCHKSLIIYTIHPR